MVGVNEYIEEAPSDIPILEMDPEGEKRHLARLAATKANRDQAAWRAAMERLEAASRDPNENTMPFIIEAVKAKATVGEISNLWRRVFGEYREQVVV